MKDCIPIQLDGLAYATVRGADADSFLQGQLSNDLRELREDRAQIGSYNSAKGRMLAALHLLRIGDAIVLELQRDLAAVTCRRLRMFVLRAKVTIDDADGAADAFGLIGNGAAGVLAGLALPTPTAALACAHDRQRGLVVMRRLGKLPRFSVHGSRAALAPLVEALGALDDFGHWRRADIQAGVPAVYPQTADHFIPQTANLDLLGGIGFDKGCYTGQEIVARLHYLGQVKRRMFVAAVDGAAPPPGSEVRRPDGVAAGEIVDATADGEHSIASVVLQLAHADSALQLADGRKLRLVQRPPEP